MKNTNTLVVCGGTGAHVALALVRLHTLGQPLGFFRDADGEPLAFPTVYLVDQDSGDGDQEATAWQLTRRLVASHPGRHDWRAAIGRPAAPELKIVTPLPLGRDRAWFDPPYDTLGRRFADSPYLDLLTSQAQRDIRFSHGMMGSPAVGSLLFRLKEFDTKSGGAGTNHDGTYRELLGRRGRVAVVGSAVGGTGASVAPTLAQRLAADGADVMAVMVLNWFRFEQEGLDEATLEKAQRRDRSMVDNANAAFAYYGQALARRVATVPVGAPDAAITFRRYTSDTQQPIRESFIHGVAALCCLRHFLDREPCGPGLYQMGAEDPTRLGGGNHLPGGDGNDSVQSLANQAANLVELLEVFAGTLSKWRGRDPFRVAPAICTETGRLASPQRVGPALSRLVSDYRKHVDEWMQDVLGVTPRPDLSLTQEALSRTRLATRRLVWARRDDIGGEDAAALALLHWTADWIRDHALGVGAASLVAPSAGAGRGYWPQLLGQDSLNVAAERPGGLTQVSDQNIQGTVQGFIQPEHVAENGWPDPMAAADYFRHAIEHDRPTERRQLAMLLVGLMNDRLTLRDIARRTGPPRLSLDRLMDEYRKELPGLARVAVVYRRPDGEVVLGFNSPHTLLCPTPIADDEKREAAWGALWQALTDSERPREWRTEAMARWRPAALALRQIRTWIANEKRMHGGAPPPWTQVFEDVTEAEPAAFGRGRTLSVFWGAGGDDLVVSIALPTTSRDYWPDEDTLPIAEDQLLTQTPALASATTDAGVTFEMAEFTMPDRDKPTRALWREHLDHLQRSGAIAAFGVRPDERRLAILTADGQAAAVLDNVVLLDRDDLMVSDCAPMQQDPVPGSSTRGDRPRYPDYPLRADYLDLVEVNDGRRIVHLLKQGKYTDVSKAVDAASPTIDEGRGRSNAIWELRLAGRSDRIVITLPVPPDAANSVDSPRAAHWMVWPRFRSTEAPHWRAYYVYEHCTDEKLHLSTLWFNPDDGCVRRCPAPEVAGAHPVRFAGGDRRAHTGGPPLAFSLENPQSGQELGLYIVRLEPLGRRRGDVNVGIDFGTSHTVAAVQADSRKDLVELPAELAPARRGPLTLHISENWSHVAGADGKPGLKALGEWLPTYTDEVAPKEMQGLLPSELLTIAPLATLSADDPARWQPGRDCVIPFMDMQRSDLADHLLSDFKWQASSEAFRGREPVLREVFLGMAIELVMADVVWRRLEGLPARVDFTFTYPLRDSSGHVQNYQRTLRRALESVERSLGCAFGLTDDIGIFNESSAAKGGTEVFGEVCLVGDLGGGTLDLFISANGNPFIDFQEVADSAKLGGNELLRTMADYAGRFVPPGWALHTDDIQTQLRAWMRSKGSARFLGDGEPERHRGLDVAGFSEPGAANAARALIERYFRLVVEYMARSLVAYLVRHWYPRVLQQRPNDHDRLRVHAQLRGNGWRLWPGTYGEIERRVARHLEVRVGELWRDRAGDRDAWRGLDDLWRKHNLWNETAGEGGNGPTVGPPACTPEESPGENPKAAPICRVVGQALPHEQIRGRAHSYALVQLEVMTQRPPTGESDQPRIRWFDPLPAPIGEDEAKVEFRRVEPPFPLSLADATGGARRELDDLEPDLKKKINQDLDKLGVRSEARFGAPIAPLVWEQAFKSKRFVEGK